MFFDRLSRGWELAGQSWEVLKRDKSLVVFPILSGIACLLVVASFLLPLFLVPGVGAGLMAVFDEDAVGQQKPTAQIAYAALLFAFYFVNYFVIVFFNTALVSCAIIRFKGGDPTLSDGLRMAASRLPQIAGWAALSATVGVILKMIEEKTDWIGQIVISLIGTAWAVATYLAVPTLAVEGVGPIEALKRSAGLIRKTWGEGLAGQFGLGWIGFLICLPGIALLFGGVFAIAMAQAVVLGAVLMAFGLIALLAGSIVTSTLKQIFIAGLYVFATEQRVPNGFSQDLMRSAFAPKR
jgi:Family of unknown function (DUF6159)